MNDESLSLLPLFIIKQQRRFVKTQQLQNLSVMTNTSVQDRLIK